MRQIASKLHCSRTLARSMIENNEELMSALKDEREGVSDMAEETVITGISQGDSNLAKWWLSRMAKDRGFGDDPMNVTVNNIPTQNTEAIKSNLDRLTPEERDLYFELCEKLNEKE